MSKKQFKNLMEKKTAEFRKWASMNGLQFKTKSEIEKEQSDREREKDRQRRMRNGERSNRGTSYKKQR